MKRFFTIFLGGCIGLLLTFQVMAQKPSCAGNSYSTEVIKKVQISETCAQYEIKVSYDGTRSFGLSHYSIGIPCGTVKNIWNSENWKQVFGKDPTTGVYGLKIDNISGFGGGRAESFTVKFTWCSDGSCNKDLGVVSYKAGQCVDYDTLSQESPQPSQPPIGNGGQKPSCKEHHKPSCTEDHSPSCAGNSFSSEVVSTKQISETCTEYKIKVSYDGTKSFGLSHYSIEIPCGDVKNIWNSESWKQVIGKDPTTGVNGLKIDNISGFGGSGAESFFVKFTVCSDNSCSRELGVVAYKAGQCVDYDTLGHPSPPQPPQPPQDTVTTPQPPQPPQPSCTGNSFSSEVVKGVQVSETCIEYEIKVSYDGTKSFGLSHYSIGVPCGNITNISNSENWKSVFGKDPTTGVYGLKIDDISGFGERGADNFTVKFTWCSDNSCNKDLGVVSYKAGQCVDYDTLDHQMPEPPLPPQDTIPDPPQPPQDTIPDPPQPPQDTVTTPPQDTTTCSSLLASLQKKNATCAAGHNGEMEVTIQEGTEPILYSWSNGATTSKVQNLAPGTYSVTVTDAKGNTLTLSESISSSPPIVISETITNPYCSGAASGAIELNVSGGSGGYTFLWSNGQTQQNIINLSSGLHTVTVTDSTGCSAQKTFMLTNSTLISATSILKHTTCNQITGGIDITPSGGIAPYTFLWSNGATTEDIQNVGAGNYNVKIKDAAGCSTQKNYILRVNTSLTLSSIIKPTSCLGDNSGGIDLSVFGGTPPYSILWADGTTAEDRTGLVEGQYAVTVTDATGCSVQANYTIFKKPLQVNSDLIQPKCNGDLGSITLTVEGIVPYTYTWSNGETDESITGLPPGFYSVTVTDASGCTRVLDFAILAPPPIIVTSAISNPLCGAEGSYAIDLTVSGGKPSYSFLWSNGATTQNLTGLNSGSYSVAITDAGGCVTNKQFTVDAISAGWSCLINQPTAPIVCSSAGNLLATSVTDGTSYQWTVTSTDNSWSITSGANSPVAVYTAGAAGSTATFTLTITKNGCSQSCTYIANSCTVKDNTGGGDPSSSEPCVTTSLPVIQVAMAQPADEPAQNTVESAQVGEEEISFKLDVYPNPFADKLNFEWTATANDYVRIEILDKFGNRMTTMYEGSVSKGQHYTFDWTASGLRERIYYYRFTSSTNSAYGKLVRQ
ncbi:MAG TPA: hypothetical protein VK589_06210 [Chryseolinea sp.]|nr:hypothetical protein [Chryseolinea sp.]